MTDRRLPQLLVHGCSVAFLGLFCACGPRATALATGPTREAPQPNETQRAPEDRASRVAIAGPEASPITFDRMSRWPEPGGHVPRSIAYSPDGKWVTFLASEKQDDENALFAFDIRSKDVRVLLRSADLAAAKAPMSREEELRRERERRKTKGITSYAWAKRAPVLVIPFAGDVFARRADGTIARLTETPEPEIDPLPCDSGERVAYVRKGALFAIDVATRREVALTKGTTAGVTQGVSDYNGQEEFNEHHGYFWSPKCDRIAYLEVDERGVEEVPLLGYRDGRTDLMMQRYPAAGGKNPTVRIGIADVGTRRTAYVRLPAQAADEKYLGRFAWSADGRALFFQMLSRDQKKRELVRVDAATLGASVLSTETSPTWIEFSDVRVLERTPRIVLTNERSGFRHIEVLDARTGAKAADLTSGQWDVAAIDGVDEDQGRVFFRATKDGPLDLHLYASKLSEPGEPARLTQEPGFHETTVEATGKGWVDVHSAADRTPRAVVHDADGGPFGELPCPLDADFAALRLRAPEFVTVRATSGDPLYGWLLRPRQVEPGKRHPVVVMVYGGPGHQNVQNKWSSRLLAEHFADRGVVVFQLDNRGTPARGRAFEGATHGHLGDIELADQLAGVDYLATLPFVDADRIGIYGHSYGGYMAALAMLRAPNRFRVGVAGSPVVDWRLYDTGYTERYMGTPDGNAKGYAAADLAPLAPNLRGKLFIIHALMDENVHFQNTARLIDALSAAGKTFDLLVFPGERHGYQSVQARRYAAERVVDYFVRNL